ncbi:hypothetical protein ACFPRL_30375 [Pseudoclavibacter helvolus]
MRFIADYLLTGRFSAAGGGVYYETGEEIFAADAPEAVAPGAEYPKTVMTLGEMAAAKTVKWGLETDITDERIARQGISVVNKGLQRLANTVIRHVDSTAMAVVSSKITSTFASPAAWTTAGKAVEALYTIATTRQDLGTGLNLDTVVLKPAQYAKLVGMLMDDKALPREQGNVAITGNLPVDALGFNWVTSPFYTSSTPLLVDREQLGGMADEKLGSPGYSSAGATGVETKSERHKDDKYEVRARRVTVPVVTDPLAGVGLTNTGL